MTARSEAREALLNYTKQQYKKAVEELSEWKKSFLDESQPQRNLNTLSHADKLNRIGENVTVADLEHFGYIKPDTLVKNSSDRQKLERYVQLSKKKFIEEVGNNPQLTDKIYSSMHLDGGYSQSHGGLQDRTIQTLDDWYREGNPLMLTKGDNTATDRIVTNLGGVELDVPVLSMGGSRFIEGTQVKKDLFSPVTEKMANKYLWASELQMMKNLHARGKAAADKYGKDPRLVHATMGDDAYRHPMFVTDAWLQSNVLTGRIPDDVLADLAEDVRNVVVQGKKPYKDFKGFEDPELYEVLKNNANLRKEIIKSGYKAKYRSQGVTTEQDIVEAFRETGGEQWGMGDTGFNAGIMDTSKPVERVGDYSKTKNEGTVKTEELFHDPSTYNAAVSLKEGTEFGGLENPLPVESMFLDVFNQPEVTKAGGRAQKINTAATAGGAKDPGVAARMAQEPTQEWLDLNSTIMEVMQKYGGKQKLSQGDIKEIAENNEALRQAVAKNIEQANINLPKNQKGEITPEGQKLLSWITGTFVFGSGAAAFLMPENAEAGTVSKVVDLVDNIATNFKKVKSGEGGSLDVGADVSFRTPEAQAQALAMDELRTQAPKYGEKVFDEVNGKYVMPEEYKKGLNDIGISTPDLVETKNADDFYNKISQAKKENKFGASVYVYDKDDYNGMRLFLTEDGTAGYALKPDGDIVSAFSTQKHKGIAPHLLLHGIEQGGKKLDAFDTVLPDIYATMGFKEGARQKWNQEYMPEDWDKVVFSRFNEGEPDVAYMAQDFGRAQPIDMNETVYVDDFGEAVALQEGRYRPYEQGEGTVLRDDVVSDKRLLEAGALPAAYVAGNELINEKEGMLEAENTIKGAGSFTAWLTLTSQGQGQYAEQAKQMLTEAQPTFDQRVDQLLQKYPSLQASVIGLGKGFTNIGHGLSKGADYITGDEEGLQETRDQMAHEDEMFKPLEEQHPVAAPVGEFMGEFLATMPAGYAGGGAALRGANALMPSVLAPASALKASQMAQAVGAGAGQGFMWGMADEEPGQAALEEGALTLAAELLLPPILRKASDAGNALSPLLKQSDELADILARYGGTS